MNRWVGRRTRRRAAAEAVRTDGGGHSDWLCWTLPAQLDAVVLVEMQADDKVLSWILYRAQRVTCDTYRRFSSICFAALVPHNNR